MTRGIRNNNPLNIRRNKANRWEGRRFTVTDEAFEEFVSMYWGFRAAFRIILNYITRYGLHTIEGIVSRWAPANENDTESYIRFVCRHTLIGGRENITCRDSEKIKKIVWSMAIQESGYGITAFGDSFGKAAEHAFS